MTSHLKMKGSFKNGGLLKTQLSSLSLLTALFVFSPSSSASSWEYSEDIDRMTNAKIYRTQLVDKNLKATLECSYPNGIDFRIQEKMSGLYLAKPEKIDIRYRIDKLTVHQSEVLALPKDEYIYFELPEKRSSRFFDEFSKGKEMLVELQNQYGERFYFSLDLSGTSSSSKRVFDNCNKRFYEDALARAIADDKKRNQIIAEQNKINSLSKLIATRIQDSWIRPASARNGMQALVQIHYLPNGDLSKVEVLKKSGDAMFDQRVVEAVYKVGRVVEIAELSPDNFERNFRRINILFNPKDLTH